MKTKEEIKEILISELPTELITEDVVNSLIKKFDLFVVTPEQKYWMTRKDICRYCGSTHEFCDCE